MAPDLTKNVVCAVPPASATANVFVMYDGEADGSTVTLSPRTTVSFAMKSVTLDDMTPIIPRA